MKKLAVAAVVAIAAVLVTLGINGAAQAYPDVSVGLNVDHDVLYSGESFTATASANVDCTWTTAWNGVERSGDGTRFATTYAAPEVTEITKIPVTSWCATGSSARTVAPDSADGKRTLTVTVLPDATAAAAAPSNNSADLPNTGGPNWIFLLVGFVLLLAGAAVATIARIRAEADLPAQTA